MESQALFERVSVSVCARECVVCVCGGERVRERDMDGNVWVRKKEWVCERAQRNTHYGGVERWECENVSLPALWSAAIRARTDRMLLEFGCFTTCGVQGWVGVPHGYSWANLYSPHWLWNQSPGGGLWSVLYLLSGGQRKRTRRVLGYSHSSPQLDACVLEISLGNEMVPSMELQVTGRERLWLPYVLTQQITVQSVLLSWKSLGGIQEKEATKGQHSSAGKLGALTEKSWGGHDWREQPVWHKPRLTLVWSWQTPRIRSLISVLVAEHLEPVVNECISRHTIGSFWAWVNRKAVRWSPPGGKLDQMRSLKNPNE